MVHKKCSHCASTDRSKGTSKSHYILQRSVLNSNTNEILAEDREGRVLHANTKVQEVDCRAKGSFSLKSRSGSMVEQHMIKTLRQPSQGALCVVTVVQVVKEHCANVSNKSPAD